MIIIIMRYLIIFR